MTKTDTSCYSKCVRCTRGVCGAIFAFKTVKKGLFIFLAQNAFRIFFLFFAFWVYAGTRERRFFYLFFRPPFFSPFFFFFFLSFSFSFFSFFFFFFSFLFFSFLFLFFFSSFSFLSSFSFFLFLFLVSLFLFLVLYLCLFLFLGFSCLIGKFCLLSVDDNGYKLLFQMYRVYARGVWRNFRF